MCNIWYIISRLFAIFGLIINERMETVEMRSQSPCDPAISPHRNPHYFMHRQKSDTYIPTPLKSPAHKALR